MRNKNTELQIFNHLRRCCCKQTWEWFGSLKYFCQISKKTVAVNNFYKGSSPPTILQKYKDILPKTYTTTYTEPSRATPRSGIIYISILLQVRLMISIVIVFMFNKKAKIKASFLLSCVHKYTLTTITNRPTWLTCHTI